MTITYKSNYYTYYTDTSSPYTDNEFWLGAAPSDGDINIGYAASKPYTTIPTTPTGWTMLGSIASGTIGQGSGTGSLSLAVYIKESVGPQSGYSNVPNTGPYNPQLYGNYGYGKTGEAWFIGASFAADTDLSTTDVLVNFPDTLQFDAGCHGLLITAATHYSATLSTPSLTIPGCVLSTLTLQNQSTSSGNYGANAVWRFSITSGAATGPATFTATTSLAAYSSIPAALVIVKEGATNLHKASPAAVAVISPKGRRNIPKAKTVPVAVISPPGTVGYNLARPSTIAVISPPATKTSTKRYADMSAALTLSVPTSGVLRSIDPATAASLGRVDGVEVQIWDPLNTQMLAIVDGRTNMEWLDDMNDTGSGSFSLSPFDPKATETNLALFNLVRFSYAGAVQFASRIETRTMAIVASDDHAGQEWVISGRGVLAMLADAVLYPEYGINAFTRQQRSFSFASREGPWYVASEWFTPRGLKMANVPDDHPWKGMPEGWPDPEAQWLWPTDPNQIASPEPAWFRSYFTLSAPATVTVYASADDQVQLYVDGFPTIATVSGDNYSFRKSSQFSIRMAAGQHLIAAEVLNTDDQIEEVVPTVTSGEVSPSYATSSNMYYVGKGFTDGGHPYVNGDGSVSNAGTGAAAFDNNDSTYWMSVGNYLGWTSAYEYVEGTFSAMRVTAVKIKAKGGPFTTYISLKNGGNNWNGTSSVPYAHRMVDTHANIRYVRQVRIERDAEVVVNVDPQNADRIRITMKADWDSGVWQFRWRAAVVNVRVTSENREGSYIRGGNFAGLLVTVATTDSAGAITGFVHRSQPEGWLVKTGSRPGWLPPHIIMKMLEEAQSRNVLGTTPLKLGFTAYVDSRGNPWAMARKDTSYNVGDDYVSIVRQITEDSDLDVWIEPSTLLIHAAPNRGQDRTSEVMLRPGQSLEDLSIESNRPMGTRMIVESEFGWMEVGDFAAEAGIGRVEGFVSLGNALSADEARQTAVNELSRFAIPTYDATISHIDTLGPRPYLDYNIGDLVTVPIGFHPKVMQATDTRVTDAYRVLAVRISEGDAGDLKVTVETDREPYALTGPGGGGTGSGTEDDNGLPPGTVLAKTASSTTLPYPGDTRTSTTLTINTAGAVYDKWNMNRLVVVAAAGVTFTNCLFNGPGVSAPAGQALITVNAAASATVDHCTLLPTTGSVGLVGAKGPGLNLVRCEIAMVTAGVRTDNGGVVIDNCWLHDMQGYAGSGAYGVVVTGGSGVDIIGTRIDGAVEDSAVWASQGGGAAVDISNFKVRSCIFGSDSQIGVYIYDGSATEEPLIPGLQITDNIFERGRQEVPISVSTRTLTAGTTTISGNIWNDGSIPPPNPLAGP